MPDAGQHPAPGSIAPAVTPGRAAYGRRWPAPGAVPWEELDPGSRRTWEDIAQAAVDAALPAVRYFADTWRELLTGMPDTYGCTYLCGEADAAAALYRALGDEGTAAAIITAHAAYDEDGDEHYTGESDS
jgi:hypothetical protein